MTTPFALRLPSFVKAPTGVLGLDTDDSDF